MKKLIVYYSLEGNTDYIAEKIALAAGADTIRLVPKKGIKSKGFLKFLWGGKSAIMEESPELEPYEADLQAYDLIIFGFPVWASNFTPPVRTFVLDNKEALEGKTIAAFACESGNGGEIALGKLAECIGIDGFAASAIFIDPLKRPSEANDEKLDEFLKVLSEQEKMD